MSRLRDRHFVGPVALVAVATFLISACGRAPALNPLGREGIVWEKRGAWSGRGSMQTETFPGKSGGLRLTWTTNLGSNPGAGAFKVSVRSAEGGRKLVDAIDARVADHGTAFVSQPPQTFYLVIDSNDVEWTVTVEDAVVPAS